MNENDIKVNLENQEKSAVYTSKFVMDRSLFFDFSSVVYNKTKKIFLSFLCLSIYTIGINLLAENYDIIIGFGPFISFLMALIYFRTKNGIKISYERNLISAGKDSTLKYELFEDRIVSSVDELKREYFYNQITKFYETKSFLRADTLGFSGNQQIIVTQRGANHKLKR